MPYKSVKPRHEPHRMRVNSLNIHAMEHTACNYFYAGVLSGMASNRFLRAYSRSRR
jgi:hypothetical protein